MSQSNDNHQAQRHRQHGHSHGKSRGSGIKNYGVWKGVPVSFNAQTLQQDRSPHITLKFDDGSGQTKEAAINVASTDSDHRLVYWLHRTWLHPITESLISLDSGFTAAKSRDGKVTELSLDFLRTKPQLLDLSAGRVLPNSEAGPENDILDQLEPILNDAISNKATVYIFGSSYGSGIHDIHMNQGSDPHFANETGSDGALIFHFPDDDHFEAVFLAFASQAVPTNDQTGAAESDSAPLSEIAQDDQVGSSSSSNS